ncbi:MAG: Sortase family protein [bacterium ADurb.Bin212]|nr:MAG: Sortase family protein [bacterium ADurb.Bin212]
MKDFKITEEDLLHIFATKDENRAKNRRYLFYLLLFFSLSIISYVAVNFSALYQSLSYWYMSDFQAQTKYSEYYPETIVNIQTTEDTKKVNKLLPDISENTLFVPKIDVSSPIKWQTNVDEKEVQKALQDGVVHLNGTALPGQNGNVFITGHSSNYPWSKGSYKNIFALLNKLVIGDLVYLNYNNAVYVYKTEKIITVKPSEIWVTGSNGTPQLSLMTCSPVGTSINRLIIRATQIYPDISKNTTFKGGETVSIPNGTR